jgi:uncharacterized protein
MLDLLDYRRQVAEAYAVLRQRSGDQKDHENWRTVRDGLMGDHPQSALDEKQKSRFGSLHYYDYDPAYRVLAEIDTDVNTQEFTAILGEDGALNYQRMGKVTFTVPGGTGTLSVFWIMGYGGGLFLPFRDGTNSKTTYGGGRYLYDTIKGADLGSLGGRLILDFNYAYNPSCAYNPRWVCPLSPPENHLDFPIPAGEFTFRG